MLGNCGQNVDGRGGKGSRACGVQVPSAFKCLRRSSAYGVQVPAAFKGSNACGVQVPTAFKGSRACGVQGFKGILVVLSVLSASVVKRVWGLGFRG